MINNFRDKHARIKVMQERADAHNKKFDQMEDDQVDLSAIPKLLA
jgi:hypothetical protein